jgi:hypothetical protein
MLVDEDVSLADAPAVSANVIAAFRDRQLITGDLTPDCVLGGTGYRLGPAVPTIYTPEPNEGRFWELMTSGVQPSVQRSFNHWALGPSCEYFVCPSCDQKHSRSDSPIWDAIFEAVGHWHEPNGDATILCPACGNAANLTEWHSRPPLGFGNLSFRFWNWPPFDLPSWKVDIPELVRGITGHRIVVSWGHL